jgi:heptaprenyl diphosphate synthase
MGLRVIRLEHLLTILANVKEQVDKERNHSYIKRFVRLPKVDEDKQLFLLTMLEKQVENREELELIGKTIALIQIALDTHEQVTNDYGMLRERQLTVLAGDYFSGLYYHLLANANHVKMIRRLAESIQRINDWKIQLYQKECSCLDKGLELMKNIEVELLVPFRQKEHDALFQFAREYLFLKRLKSEKERFVQKQDSVLMNLIQTFTLPNQKEKTHLLSNEQRTVLFNCLERLIDSSFTSAKLLLKGKVNSTYWNKQLSQLADTLYLHTKSFVEEG